MIKKGVSYLLNLRNRLCKRYPFFAYILKTERGKIEIKLRHDLNSFSCKEYVGDTLESIRTSRHNFSESYNLKFGKDGKRIYALYTSKDRIMFNHRGGIVNIMFDDDDIQIIVQQHKQNEDNSYEE